jgi:Uma2 family endonuclease
MEIPTGAGAQQLITAEEFWRMPETHMKCELVRGEIVETMPLGGEHGGIALELGSRLRTWAKQGRLYRC